MKKKPKNQGLAVPTFKSLAGKSLEKFRAFTEFMAAPGPERAMMLGFEINPITKKYDKFPSQNDFANRYKVHKDTLTDWKKRPEYAAAIETDRKQWVLDRMPDALQALFNRILKYGMSYDVETFAKFGEIDLREMAKRGIEKFDQEDVRVIIQSLSIEEQNYFYGTLGQLIGVTSIKQRITKSAGHRS